MNFPFNFLPNMNPFFNNDSQQFPQQNDMNFFSNPFFGQPFFNNPGFNNPNNPQNNFEQNNYSNFNPFQNQTIPPPNQNPTFNQNDRKSPRKKSDKSKKPNENFSGNLKLSHSEHLKNLGNDYFKAGNYPMAIDYYTKAIEKDSNQSTFYLNRAICFKYLKNFNEVIKDCNVAIELDDFNYKAYLLLGRTLAEIGKYDNNTERIKKAIMKIEKAVKIYSTQNPTDKSHKIMKELKTYFRRAQKLLWYKSKELSKAQNSDIYSYINNAFKTESITQNQKNEILKNLEIVVANPYKNEENNYIIPDEFCCKITLDIMEEPMLCPSGVSYEAKILFEHLKNHDFDPVTRETLSQNQVLPNITLKMAIDYFLTQNPWAFEFAGGENYLYIEF